MAEEEATSAAPPVATEADAADKSKDNGKKHKKREDEVPIEELYDLSKPIPRVSTSAWCFFFPSKNDRPFFVGNANRKCKR